MIFNTDIIDIKNITEDPIYGNQSESIQSDISARIEDTNKLIRNSKGENVKANSLIIVEPSIDINIGDRVVFKKRMGTDINDSREFEVIQVFTAGGFSASHKEVYI